MAMIGTLGCEPASSTSSVNEQIKEEENAPEANQLGAVDRLDNAGSDFKLPSTESEVTPVSSNASQVAPPGTAVLLLTGPLPTASATMRQEAEALLGELASRPLQSPDSLEVQARFHFMFGQNAEAEKCWQRALELVPNYAYAHHGLAKVAMLRSEYSRAKELLTQAIVDLSGNEDVVHDLHNTLMKLGEVSEAIRILDQYVERNGGSADSYLLLGNAFLTQKDYARAKESFERVLSLDPESTRGQQGLGSALLRLGMRTEAQQLLEKQRARRQETSSQNRSAEEVFAAECSDYSTRYLFAARVYSQLGDQAMSEALLRRATELNPQSTKAWTLLFDFLQQHDRLVDAVLSAEHMCEINPKHASCHFTLGVLRNRAGRPKEALAAFQRAHELAPESPLTLESMIRIQVQQRLDIQRATELARKLVSLRGLASDHELLAQCWAVQGNLDQAFTELTAAIELDPANVNYQQAMEQLRQARGESK